ncbi:hypothetical protein IG631_02468 [Alternaria alternata]|nr:hypothetical protein IG631_02468 [Alternaria alternata]
MIDSKSKRWRRVGLVILQLSALGSSDAAATLKIPLEISKGLAYTGLVACDFGARSRKSMGKMLSDALHGSFVTCCAPQPPIIPALWLSV